MANFGESQACGVVRLKEQSYTSMTPGSHSMPSLPLRRYDVVMLGQSGLTTRPGAHNGSLW